MVQVAEQITVELDAVRDAACLPRPECAPSAEYPHQAAIASSNASATGRGAQESRHPPPHITTGLKAPLSMTEISAAQLRFCANARSRTPSSVREPRSAVHRSADREAGAALVVEQGVREARLPNARSSQCGAAWLPADDLRLVLGCRCVAQRLGSRCAWCTRRCVAPWPRRS